MLKREWAEKTDKFLRRRYNGAIYLSAILLIIAMMVGAAGSAAGESTDMKTDESRINLGIAMYNFVVGRDYRSIDSMDGLKGLLEEIKDYGYDGVEWFNDKLNDSYMDLPLLKEIMDELGLQSCSLHFAFRSLDTLDEEVRIAIDRCLVLGTDKLILAQTSPGSFGITADADGNWSADQIDEWVFKANQVLKVMQDAAEGTGIKILYHNHDREFCTCSDGSYVLDKLTADGKQIDMYWAAKGMDGNLSSAIDYIKANKEDIWLLHIKDGTDGTTQRNDICSWGSGTYDIQSILDIAKECRNLEWVIAENDTPAGSGLEDAKETAVYAAVNLDFTR